MSDRVNSTDKEIFLQSNGEYLRLIKANSDNNSLLFHIQSRKFISTGIIKDKKIRKNLRKGMVNKNLNEIKAEKGDIVNLFTELKKEDVVEFVVEFIKWINKDVNKS